MKSDHVRHRGKVVGYVSQRATDPTSWNGYWIGPSGEVRVAYGVYKGTAIRLVLERQKEA